MKPVRLMLVAVGGQGNLLAAKVLGEAAMNENLPVRMSEIHGMAQRGGVVESAIVFGEAESSLIADGEADILVGFEPLETLRALPKCNRSTTVITNTAPIPPFAAAVGNVPYPELEQLKEEIAREVGGFYAFDAAELALQAGSVMSVNMVMVGALAASGLLPMDAEAVLAALKTTVRKNFVDMNVKAFQLGGEAFTSLAG